MTQETRLRTGGRLLVDQLLIHGTRTAFCVPGESFIEVLDALYDTPEIRLISCRQEGGAAMMADAHGKLTGEPGICIVTRGPGASNAMAGLHLAAQDSTPMILLIGQVPTTVAQREASQEIDYGRVFGPMVKWAASIDDPARIPEFVSRAFYTATAGRPGPVVLGLPADVLARRVAVADLPPYRRVLTHPGEADMAQLRALLARAERPLLVLGGSAGWDQTAWEGVRTFAAANDLPAATTFHVQDLFDNTHPCYAGDIGGGAMNPVLGEHIREADVILAVGSRLDQLTTRDYSLVEAPRPKQTLVHVFPDPEEIGRVYRPELGIVASMPAFAAALGSLEPVVSPRWAGWRRRLNADYLAFSNPDRPDGPGDMQLHRVMAWLRERLPAEAIMSDGAGVYNFWVHRYMRYQRYHTQLSPTSGSMGFGLPAALAAKVLYPSRMVVAFAGDGCLLMTGQELATAVQYGLGVIVIVINNASYGAIRLFQERVHPGRPIGTELRNPDFAALGRSFGAFGEVVTRTEEFAGAFERAVASGGPAVVEVRIPIEALTPAASLSEIRAQGEAAAAERGGGG